MRTQCFRKIRPTAEVESRQIAPRDSARFQTLWKPSTHPRRLAATAICRSSLLTDQVARFQPRLVTDQPPSPESVLLQYQPQRSARFLRCEPQRASGGFLLAKGGNPNDYRLPDFTVSYEGDIFYWEHLGMLTVPADDQPPRASVRLSRRQPGASARRLIESVPSDDQPPRASVRFRRDRKFEWYKTNGYLDQLITSEDRPDGSISSPEIEALARKHILLEDE